MKRTLRAAISFVAVAALACTGNPNEDPDGNSAPLGCDGDVPELSEYFVDIEHAGATRRATVHLPPAYDGVTPLGLVLNFHGLGSNANEEAFYTDMDAAVDARGDFIAVYPQGLANSQGDASWDGGLCCQDNPVDDLGFITALLDELEATVCIDTNRVFSTGMSNGGIFSYRLGCDMSDRIAAIAPVAGMNLTNACAPTREVPLVHYHGTDDQTVPYNGGTQFQLPSLPEQVEAWASTVNGCSTTPTETFRNGDVHCDTWACGDGPVSTLCTVDGGGHTWPGAIDVPSLGYTTQDVDATTDILDFFAANPLK